MAVLGTATSAQDAGIRADYARAASLRDRVNNKALNVIANPRFTLGGATIDASAITPELLAQTLREAGAIEANVATGYHAIEFLLWGQDLNGVGPGAGDQLAHALRSVTRQVQRHSRSIEAVLLAHASRARVDDADRLPCQE